MAKPTINFDHFATQLIDILIEMYGNGRSPESSKIFIDLAALAERDRVTKKLVESFCETMDKRGLKVHHLKDTKGHYHVWANLDECPLSVAQVQKYELASIKRKAHAGKNDQQ